MSGVIDKTIALDNPGPPASGPPDPAPSDNERPLDQTWSLSAGVVTLAPALAARATEEGSVLAGESIRRSVLPRIEPTEGGLRLLPQEGPRFAPKRTLGRGGMGEVQLVEDRDIGREVAIKKLLADAASPSGVARFAQEIRIIGRLEHPNIVPIHDVGVGADGCPYFVMKYLEGETLESIIERLAAGDAETLARFPVQRRIEIFRGLLQALSFAHQRGVVHRDIKPSNVMVGRFGEVVLMDWGVAGPIRSGDADASTIGGAETQENPAEDRNWQTRAGDLVGTPLYMAPEQARGMNDEIDARTDLYSACILLHELLGLKQRHGALRNQMAVLLAVSTAEAMHAHDMFPREMGIPAEFGHFITRGTKRDPAERWQSADEMLDELGAIQRGECRVQCPVTLSRRGLTLAGRLLDRYPMVAMLAAGLGALTLLAGMFSFGVLLAG